MDATDTQATPVAPEPRAPEPKATFEQLYQEVRSARIGIHVIAWITGICFVVSIITGIVVGVQIAHATNSGDTLTSSCTVDEMNAGIC